MRTWIYDIQLFFKRLNRLYQSTSKLTVILDFANETIFTLCTKYIDLFVTYTEYFTYNMYVFRFRIVESENREDWVLIIRLVVSLHSGWSSFLSKLIIHFWRLFIIETLICNEIDLEYRNKPVNYIILFVFPISVKLKSIIILLLSNTALHFGNPTMYKVALQ